jgi:mRNA interferase RelE/StbE
MYNFRVSSEYEVEIENSAAKVLQRLQHHDRVRVSVAIVGLGDEPRPHGCEKLSGFDATYRIRVGDYRIVYLVADGVRVVTVTRVGHRREVYR